IRSRAAVRRFWAWGSLSSRRLTASAARSRWSTTSSSIWRKTSEPVSSGSPSPIRPWATASRLTSDTQTVLPSTRAAATSPRSGADGADIEDIFMGNVAHGGGNVARQAGLLAGLPITTSGVTVNRFCSSGLQTIAMAASYVRNDGANAVVAGGVESISMPNPGVGRDNMDPELLKVAPDIFMAMIDTADIVAKRYNLSREYQDEYSLESQRRMAAAQQANKFADEIVPMK